MRDRIARSTSSGNATTLSAVSGRPPIAYDVRKRIGCRYPSEIERIVNDGREEIDGLHERRFIVEEEDAGVVAGCIADEHARVGRVRPDAAQYVVQLGGAQLCGAAGAGAECGEADALGVHRKGIP